MANKSSFGCCSRTNTLSYFVSELAAGAGEEAAGAAVAAGAAAAVVPESELEAVLLLSVAEAVLGLAFP